MRRSIVRIALWGLVGVVTTFVVVGATTFVSPKATAPSPASMTPVGGEFELTDQDGRPRTWASFRGRPAAVFFGFTNCPDICPTTLGELTVLLQQMGAKGDDLSVVLISGDPGRDTPAVLKDYLSSFDPRIVGLTGPEPEIDKAFAAFKAYRKIVPIDDGNYTIDHSAGVYLYDRDGSFAGTLDMHELPEVRLTKLEKLVSR